MNDTPAGIAGNILVVDDTPTNIRLLSQMLTEEGHIVRAATSGTRALSSVEASQPDLVLLDIRMPEMDGYEVCRRLKSQIRTRDIPVLFISALDELQDKIAAFEAGGVDYITKPFQMQEVIARVNTHLHLRQLQKRLEDANRRLTEEMALAGEIQASFLPNAYPSIPGWQLAATLEPAQETSGDFFDIIPLSGGKVGLLVADVVDKGVGAALYMALSRTIIRMHAQEPGAGPSSALAAANAHILADTRANQFVTVFYCVLEPEEGRLVFCNAGHNPPVLLARDGPSALRKLTRTGMPLGIFEDASWDQASTRLARGDTVVMYSDGIPDAINTSGEVFGEERLLATIRAAAGSTATETRDKVLAAVADFVGDAPTYDDITLLVLARDLG